MKEEVEVKSYIDVLEARRSQNARDMVFAPRDGYCWRCHKQIYEKITVKKATEELITGCPWCHYSFVE